MSKQSHILFHFALRVKQRNHVFIFLSIHCKFTLTNAKLQKNNKKRKEQQILLLLNLKVYQLLIFDKYFLGYVATLHDKDAIFRIHDTTALKVKIHYFTVEIGILNLFDSTCA